MYQNLSFNSVFKAVRTRLQWHSSSQRFATAYLHQNKTDTLSDVRFVLVEQLDSNVIDKAHRIEYDCNVNYYNQSLKGVLVMATSVMQVRVDDDLKAKATAVYEELGIDLPTAIRMFLKRSVIVNGVPFSMMLPKSEDRAERAIRAMQSLSDAARENGTAEMTLDEINAEIASARAERKTKGGSAV